MAPKKGGAGGGGGGGDDDDQSPRGLNSEEASRLNEMEHRVAGLEDQLAKAMEEVRDARSREMGIMNVVRDVITHLATVEKGLWSGSEPANRQNPTVPLAIQTLRQEYYTCSSTLTK